jgi:hypothetical protein
MTVEQFRELPPDKGPWLHELHFGEVVTSARPPAKHYKLQVRLAHLLEVRAGNLGVVGIEMCFRAIPEFDLRAADVAFISQERWDAIDPEDNLRGAPELVVEVKSESNTWRELRERASLCLANAARISGLSIKRPASSLLSTATEKPCSIRRRIASPYRCSAVMVCALLMFSHRIESDADSALHRQFQVLRQV